jgi:hypothetical protein
MGEMKNPYNILVENLKERDHLQNPSEDGRITLTWISKK